jgi:hypothetical protein
MIAADDNPADPLQEGGGDGTVSVSAAETVAVRVSTGGALQEYCSTNGSSPSTAQDAGLLAVRMLSSSGTLPAAPAQARQTSRPRS